MIFDKKCIFCSKSGDYICEKCLTDMQKYKYPNIDDKIIIGYCYKNEVRKAIIDLKFNNKRHNSRALGKMLIESFEKFDLSKIDIITFVPISRIRMFRRGYNQCELILKEICKIKNLKMDKKILKRKHSISQTKVEGNNRELNVKDKFYVNTDVKDKNILILEDVYTTGATIKEIRNTLLKNGANEVFVCVLAKK